ncbi:MAG: YggS family pyridoxal phosphate-dependent enzyme [Deltaproteobacteria bacterium]|nr:YggS family pyridoxal phosphate-dependent enzyme [Deltaproteobacteria bacterium]
MEAIAQNLEKIRSRLAVGAVREPPLLIAVCKGQPKEKILEAIAAGQIDFGENYAQELMGKYNALLENPPSSPFVKGGDGGGFLIKTGPVRIIRWHFIGHLQTNKVKQVIDKVEWIHSVDSEKLAREIDKQASAIGKRQKILIEVNLAGESSKTGISQEGLFSLITVCHNLPSISLHGLMTLPPPAKDPRPYFRRLKETVDEINQKKLYRSPLTELSMGMTDDYEVALEEGATMIRIGTGVFGKRIPSP